MPHSVPTIAIPSLPTPVRADSARLLRVVIAVGLTIMAGAASAAIAVAPKAGRPVAIIGVSDTQAQRIAAVGEAGGAVVAAAGHRITVATADDAGFLGRMLSLGYWIMLDAQAVGCVSQDSQRRP